MAYKDIEKRRAWDRDFAKTLKGRYKYYQRNAKTRNVDFNLSFDVFCKLVDKNCYYCQKPSYGIDRIDNSKGYELTNVVTCCTMCNKMKIDYNLKDFIDHCRLVALRFTKKNQ